MHLMIPDDYEWKEKQKHSLFLISQNKMLIRKIGSTLTEDFTKHNKNENNLNTKSTN